MNIRRAKEEIRKTVEIYLDKEMNGEYTIPPAKQRPLFLIGAPGIGKTAVVEQVARELGIGFVSYSMTHHTRQSAIGLPYIEEREYDEKKVRISEYTVSEIIASVYDAVKYGGHKEGILFLDEINCVSETLFPALLQFLQYKSFGNHVLPGGWVIVTAGNPPRYNRFVREFDIAVLDRLKILKVEESLDAWKPYAVESRIHGAITTFLELEPSCFYHINSDEEGPRYVTARGWEDLSLALMLYEKKGFEVDSVLIGQYLADSDIAAKFEVFYRLYGNCRERYPVEDILFGRAEDELLKRAEEAPFDERLAVLELVSDRLYADFESVLTDGGPPERENADKNPGNNPDKSPEVVSDRLESAFRFVEDAWGQGQELSFFLTKLTVGNYSALFIAQYGSESYMRFSEKLLTFDRREKLKAEIQKSYDGK